MWKKRESVRAHSDLNTKRDNQPPFNSSPAFPAVVVKQVDAFYDDVWQKNQEQERFWEKHSKQSVSGKKEKKREKSCVSLQPLVEGRTWNPMKSGEVKESYRMSQTGWYIQAV